MIAGRDEDPAPRLGFGHPDAIALIGLAIEFDILDRIGAQPVQPRIVGAPLRVGEPIEEAAVVTGPHDLGKHPWDHVGQMLAGLEILDMDGEAFGPVVVDRIGQQRSEEHTSELQSLMRNSYAVYCLKKKK